MGGAVTRDRTAARDLLYTCPQPSCQILILFPKGARVDYGPMIVYSSDGSLIVRCPSCRIDMVHIPEHLTAIVQQLAAHRSET